MKRGIYLVIACGCGGEKTPGCASRHRTPTRLYLLEVVIGVATSAVQCCARPIPCDLSSVRNPAFWTCDRPSGFHGFFALLPRRRSQRETGLARTHREINTFSLSRPNFCRSVITTSHLPRLWMLRNIRAKKEPHIPITKPSRAAIFTGYWFSFLFPFSSGILSQVIFLYRGRNMAVPCTRGWMGAAEWRPPGHWRTDSGRAAERGFWG